MEHIDLQYQRLVREILQSPKKQNRTWIATYSLACWSIRHDMSDGFPLLTTKKMSLKTIAAELECFLKWLHTKKDFHQRNCHIWDERCDPRKVPYGHDPDTKKRMFEEDELGRIYGVQRRDWMWSVDQLAYVVQTLKTNPFDRRMVVSARNPAEFDAMALPPCHYAWQVIVTLDHQGNFVLNLVWNQRSVDTMLWLPYNIASYALLLLLLAKEAHMIPGILMWSLGDVHIYENHVDNARIQLTREPYPLPRVEIAPFTSIFEWKYTDFVLHDYQSHPALKFDIAV